MSAHVASLTPRQRYLLRAAWEGRVYVDPLGRYWLDRTSSITVEFRPLVRHGYAKPPDVPSVAEMRRLVWIESDAAKSFERWSR